MNPRVWDVLAAIRRSPFVVSLYGVKQHAENPWRTIREAIAGTDAIFLQTYYNRNTRRQNVEVRFTTDARREAALERLAETFPHFRVWDDSKKTRGVCRAAWPQSFPKKQNPSLEIVEGNRHEC